uniref:RNA cytidine acetyltransferase n=1 Tax=Romanomermis culicivorax TaxID=13658 RepID=A0A915KZF8_ROMCU
MSRKKLDNRIRTLIENGVALKRRSLFVVVGNKSKDEVVILHHILSKSVVKARPSVLWCYKKELGFSSHRKKRMRQLKKRLQSGKDVNEEDPFELFISSTQIRYCYYSETHKILGNTYGMCVLQDFEALTPNLLARTIETVEGGGLVIILLQSLSSLRQLYTMTMDVHARYRTEAHKDIVARFNERFILSLASCKSCLVVDDQLNILPISVDTVNLQAVPASAKKTLRATVSLTAARGRGKSAALGLAIAGAIAFGYSNIFVTSPSPENLKTLFEFVFKGFDALEYQYIHPSDAAKLGQAELLVIDEAAAIPLPLVKQLFGPYLVFMSSTINGYEGTGRSLSLKLIQQLREQTAPISAENTKKSNSENAEEKLLSASGRTLTELVLDESIRYAPGDHVELWLNQLLCLDASIVKKINSGCPPPTECDLYYVNRDTLFCFHKASEAFLQRLMSIYVAAHYKNSPNDLQMLSDAPAHQLYVLLGPVSPDQSTLPEILCVGQVCLEGEISKSSVSESLSQGKRPSGDMIPWTVAQQFQDNDFPSLSGARIVRIATHPDYQCMGYGSRTIQLLEDYFEGRIAYSGDSASEEEISIENEAEGNNLLEEHVIPRKNLPPLLLKLSEKRAMKLDWLGVSFGLTNNLLKYVAPD